MLTAPWYVLSSHRFSSDTTRCTRGNNSEGDFCCPRRNIFCACKNRNFDYTRRQKSVRSAWRSLTSYREAGYREAGLPGIRIHDLRHTARLPTSRRRCFRKYHGKYGGPFLPEDAGTLHAHSPRREREGRGTLNGAGDFTPIRQWRPQNSDVFPTVDTKLDTKAIKCSWNGVQIIGRIGRGERILNLRPPGPKLGSKEPILLIFNHLSSASTVPVLLNHARLG